MTLESAIRQLREDLGNALYSEDETAVVPVDALDTLLAEYGRLSIEVEGLRGEREQPGAPTLGRN